MEESEAAGFKLKGPSTQRSQAFFAQLSANSNAVFLLAKVPSFV
jgi:hypothetical protein